MAASSNFVTRSTRSGEYVKFNAAALRQLLEGQNGAVGQDLTKRALRVEAAAKRLAPVDTGRLRTSISHEIGRDAEGLLAKIGSSVTYAAAQEFGTRYMSAQPYLRPALRAAR